MTLPHQHTRRGMLGLIAATSAVAATGLRATPSWGAAASWPPLARIDAGDLSVAYADLGPRDGTAVVLLHGWPYDIHSYAEVAPRLAEKGHRVIVPFLRGYGGTRFRAPSTLRNGQQSATAVDTIALMDALGIRKAVLGGFDWGARTADVIAALWPERCRALVSVSGYLIGSQKANEMPLPPQAELLWWYQFYFATERGRLGYERNRYAFNKLIWHTASPRWSFDDNTYERSARSFENPDHVAVVVSNYRWRLGLATSEPRFDAYERKLATLPSIGVPTITMEGDANGAAHPKPADYVHRFTGPYVHRDLTGGIGHNLPQEAPEAFVTAVMDVQNLS